MTGGTSLNERGSRSPTASNQIRRLSTPMPRPAVVMRSVLATPSDVMDGYRPSSACDQNQRGTEGLVSTSSLRRTVERPAHWHRTSCDDRRINDETSSAQCLHESG